ncbi:MAG: hypothetical protein JEZ09_04290 [Salinivirgaceae bacterium]|nr:hypothetical protein [Salinivirgaceae bacterium]
MQVFKFGGTSVGSVARIKEVAELIKSGDKKIVILSAMSGTTNALVEIAEYLYKKNNEGANEKINHLETKYNSVLDELFSSERYLTFGKELIKNHFEHLRSFTRDMFTQYEEKEVLAQGELISTALLHYYLLEKGLKSELLSALNFMRIDKAGEPDEFYIKENLKRELSNLKDVHLIIT